MKKVSGDIAVLATHATRLSTDTPFGDPMQSLDDAIRNLIRESGVKGRVLARSSGVDAAVISRFLAGKRSPTLDTVGRLLKSLTCEVALNRRANELVMLTAGDRQSQRSRALCERLQGRRRHQRQQRQRTATRVSGDTAVPA
jgi:transcriptional regulator with XRE-family HTH domain